MHFIKFKHLCFEGMGKWPKCGLKWHAELKIGHLRKLTDSSHRKEKKKSRIKIKGQTCEKIGSTEGCLLSWRRSQSDLLPYPWSQLLGLRQDRQARQPRSVRWKLFLRICFHGDSKFHQDKTLQISINLFIQLPTKHNLYLDVFWDS